MKTTRFLNMMAASLVGVAFMSCSSQDDVLTPAGQTYTMSVTAQKGGDGTRALSLSGEGNKTLNATWTAGDEVKVYNSTSELIGTLTAQSAGATTTLTGDLTKLPTTGDELMLKYLSPSYSQQDGTLTGTANSIDKVCDYATATVTATVSGTNVTTDAAAFQNQQAVVKFTLEDKADGTTKLNPTAFTMTDGTSTVELTNIPAETYTTNGEGVLYVAIPGFTGKTITLTATVGSDTYTCTTSEAKTLENGKYYGVTAKMAKQAAAPEGAISGQFTVNSNGDKVYFSQGNLQLTAADTWKFADNQWETFGSNQSDNHRDLFGWGTGNNPNQTSNFNAGYTFTDWGSNAISNGGNTAGSWRTLSKDEWKYVFGTNDGDKRSGATVGGTSNARYTEATINTDGTGVNGVILFPDGATFAADEATWGTINAASAWGTRCTTAQWTALEAKGCVFLPAAGWRSGTSVSYVGSDGYYWSSTADGTDKAYYVYFGSGSVGPERSSNRNGGRSVRLVKDVAAPAPAVPTGALSGKFSVSATKKVKFSKGNLRATYNGSSWTWSFATNQYDYIGNAEGNTKVSGSDPFVTGYTGSSTTVDLFGWSTSITYLGINNSTNNNTYSGDSSNPGIFVDWGSHADVIAGIGSGWFTLSGAEWAYLFGMESKNKDKSGHARYRKYFRAQVNGVSGIVFLPDDISGISNIPAESSRGTASTFSGKTYTTDAWSALESAGCVFLPAAGGRNGSTVSNAGTLGCYWSATPYNAGQTYYVGIYSNTLYPGSTSYSTLEYGNSVRLVREVE